MQNIVSINTRLATMSDVDALTRLHLASFSSDEHIGTLIGPRFVKASYKWHVTDKKAYVIVSESDGTLLGFLGMCDGPFTMRMLRGSFSKFILSLLLNPHLLIDYRLWARLKKEKQSIKWLKDFCEAPGVAQMTIGAVDANARGHNVFPALIKACEEISKKRDIAAIRAGVYRVNISCQRAFLKSGWIEVSELGSVETVFFVYILDPELLIKFPQLKLVTKNK